MAFDTLLVYCGVYGQAADALADYELIKDLHTEANLIDAYDAAVIERDHKGKVKIVKKHETLDEGEAGLVVVAVSDMEAKVRSAMKRARKVEEKQLEADQKELEADAAEARAS